MNHGDPSGAFHGSNGRYAADKPEDPRGASIRMAGSLRAGGWFAYIGLAYNRSMSNSFYLDYASQLADQGDLAAAEDALRVLLRMSGLRPEAILALAEILFRQGRPADAVELLLANASHTACADRLREHHVGESDFEAAMALLISRPSPPTVSGWLDKALMRQIDGDLRGAIGACHAALALEPDAVHALNALGRAQFNSGHIDQARNLFTRATVLAPGSTEAWHNLGHVLRAQNDLRGAEQAYLRALAFAPAHRSSRRNLAVTLLMAGRPAEALPLLEQLTQEDGDDDDAQINLGVCLQLLNRSAEAELKLRGMLEKATDHFVVLAQLGRLLQTTGKVDEAVGFLQRALKLRPRKPDVRITLAMALLQLKRYQEAIAIIHAGLVLNPKQPHLLELLAKANKQVAGLRQSPGGR